MELTESIRSRAHRTLKGTANFVSSDQSEADLPHDVKSSLLPAEELLGIYQNSDSDPLANLVFTTRGVYKFDQRWLCLPYDQMTHVSPMREKGDEIDMQNASILFISLKDGTQTDLMISGGVTKLVSGYKRRFPDLFEVLRFLIRVTDRMQQDQP